MVGGEICFEISFPLKRPISSVSQKYIFLCVGPYLLVYQIKVWERSNETRIKLDLPTDKLEIRIRKSKDQI